VSTSTAVAVTINRNQLRSALHIVCVNSTALDGDALKSNQALSNLLVGRSINAVAFEITKEIVQGIVIALSGVEGGMLANLAAVLNRIIDRTVGLLLLRSIVAIVGCMVGVVGGSRAGVHLSTVVIITSVGCKVLQVSNH